jgi:hypothetical protein
MKHLEIGQEECRGCSDQNKTILEVGKKKIPLQNVSKKMDLPDLERFPKFPTFPVTLPLEGCSTTFETNCHGRTNEFPVNVPSVGDRV